MDLVNLNDFLHKFSMVPVFFLVGIAEQFKLLQLSAPDQPCAF